MSRKGVEDVLGKKDIKRDVKGIVEYVLGEKDVKELWAAGYWAALPVTPQGFSLGSVLPVVLYVMRWGHRRGRGKFASVYGKDATIDDISTALSCDEKRFQGFGGKPEQAVLGDLLLAYCLENKGHQTGRDRPVQRVFPAHYFSSWVDLPLSVAHLRGVPEVVAAVLAHQSVGASVSRGQRNGHYSIGVGFEENLLLALFGAGTRIDGDRDNVRSDHFEEETPLGIDQLMVIRLAQSLGEAPMKVRGEAPEVPNQQPVAQLASERFYEDLDVFLRSYGQGIPRQSLLPMIESCLAISLMNIFLSTLDLLLHWSANGSLPQKHQQKSWPLFVDCSGSADMSLRRVSEECFDDLIRRMSRLPVSMMCLRILDQRACQERMALPPTEPDPTKRINSLGDLLFGRLEGSRDLERDLRKDCNKLSDALKQKGEIQVCQVLDSEAPHPAWRLAEALVTLMGEKLQGAKFRQFLDSSLMVDQPNGIARKRRIILNGKSTERHSLILTNTVLDFLVHRHLRQATTKRGQANLSLADFIRVLKDRYGFHIDEAPPGLSIPADDLRKNRGYLERKLRDLGLFAGVNDAEAMKRLRPRFEVDNDSDY